MEHYQNTRLSYKEMQELLPDYVFGRLSDNDKKIFEYNLFEYPDINEEVIKVREVFQKVEDMKLDAKIEGHTRNLSVKVQERLRRMPKSLQYQSIIFRYIIPTLGILIIAVLILTNKWERNDGTTKSNLHVTSGHSPNAKVEFTMIKPSDALIIFDSTITPKNYFEISSELSKPFEDVLDLLVSGISPDATKEQDVIDEILNENIFNVASGLNLDATKELFPSYPFSPVNNIFKHLSTIDENDFQLILKAMQNEDFIS